MAMTAMHDRTLIRLGKLMGDKEAFVILYDLVARPRPVGAAELCRSYGADGRDMRGILDHLTAIGFVQRRGQAYVATEVAKSAVRLLEETLDGVQLEAAEAASAQESVGWHPTACAGSIPVVEAATNNGTWEEVSTKGIVLSGTRRVVPIRGEDAAAGQTDQFFSSDEEGRVDAAPPDYASL